MLPAIDGITFDTSQPDRLKVILPVKRNWFLFLAYSLMLLASMVLFFGGIVYAVQIAFSGARYAFAFVFLIVLFLFAVYRLWKFVWRQWQFYVSNREILFIDAQMLIIRRPVSILGITDAYDWQHVRPFSYSKEYSTPMFEYGQRNIFFGQSLSREQADKLIWGLNDRYFPEYDDYDGE